jgi:hypothetical protein
MQGLQGGPSGNRFDIARPHQTENCAARQSFETHGLYLNKAKYLMVGDLARDQD